MTILLIGLICLVAALRALRRPLPASAWWVAPIALLALVQLFTARHDIARYRFSLLGLRYEAVGEDGRVVEQPLRIGGDYETADLYVPGAGERAAVHLRANGTGAVESVFAEASEDAASIGVIEERARFRGTRLRVLGARAIAPTDTIIVRGPAEVRRLVVGTIPDTLHLLGLGVPMPWSRLHVVSDASGDGTPVVLPRAASGTIGRILGRAPSVLARTYPLADVLDLARGDNGGLPPLTSFLFYSDGKLTLADLDSEVDVAPLATPAALPVWTRAGGSHRLLIAAAPLRDYPELKLTLPERYGIRPLRSITIEANGAWIDARFASPEIRSLDRAALDALTLPRQPGGDSPYRVRMSHARNSLVRQAVVFESPPGSFASGSQAILALDPDPRAKSFGVLTPAGMATWRTGRPMPLGDRHRALLVRIDGQSTSPLFWLLLATLFAMCAAVIRFRRPAGPAFALAIAAIGFAAIRVLLDLSALLAFPFVQEGQQIGLWLLPVLPWAIVVAAEREGRPARLLHTIYAFVTIALTLVLFGGSLAKQLALSAVSAGLLGIAMLRGTAATASLKARIASLAPKIARSGLALGLALLAFRVLLDLVGWREGIMIGGTRIAVSVIYTPAALAALAWLMHVEDARIAGTPATDRERAVARAGAGIAVFMILAFVAVGFWISDFGIALVTLPGALVLVALMGARWAPRTTWGRVAASAFALPLVLFALVQFAPRLLAPMYRADATRADVRMGEWNRNELLLLERGDPQALRLIGQRRSEALAVMRETMRSYTRHNVFGKGFLEGGVSNEIRDTATREHVVSALLARQWGLAGAAGLVFLLLALIAPVAPSSDAARASNGSTLRRAAEGPVGVFIGLLVFALVLPAPYDLAVVLLVSACIVGATLAPLAGLRWGGAIEAEASNEVGELGALVARMFLFVVVFSGLYMVLANYGLVFFTGKNVYLLGLDSVSDALESLILLCVAAALLPAARPHIPDHEARLEPARRPALAGGRPALPLVPS